MKRLLAILFLFTPVVLHAQPQPHVRLDSALKELSARYGNKEDTGKVLLLNLIARGYVNVVADSMTAFASRGLKLAEKLNFKHGEINCLLTLGSSLLANNFNTALAYNFRALKIAEETKNNLYIANALDGIGGCYYNMSKFKEALEYFVKSNTYFELLGGNGDAITLNNICIGGCYIDKGDIPKGMDYLKTALKYYEETGNIGQASLAYDNIGVAYSRMQDYSKALACTFKALRLLTSLGAKVNTAGTLNGVGDVYLSIATDTSYTIHPDSLIPPTRKANAEKAVSFLTQSLSQYRQRKSVPLYALSDLANALEANGNYKEALDLMQEYNKRKDSILSKDINIKIAQQETKRQAELKELAETQRKNEQRFYIAGFLLLLLLVTVVSWNYRKQRKLNGQLAAEKAKSDSLVATQEILVHKQEKLLQQKDVLMKEIHHRVKNNLQVIGSLLDLQLENIVDTNAQKAMNEGMSRVKSISLIHQQLYQNEDVSSVEFSKFVKDLLMQVTYLFKKPGQNVALISELPVQYLDIDTAIPLGLILNELMTNSYKYAFDGNGDGAIEISLAGKAPLYELIYKDSGPGLPAGFDMNKGGSMGLMVIRSLSKELGGIFRYDAAGKQFIIAFKEEDERRKTA